MTSSPNRQEIRIAVELDDQRVPEAIQWQATDAPDAEPQPCEAMLLSVWDKKEKAAYRIDLWTKTMPIDEMNAFIVQTIASLAETYERATQREELAEHIREFARLFAKESQSNAGSQS